MTPRSRLTLTADYLHESLHRISLTHFNTMWQSTMQSSAHSVISDPRNYHKLHKSDSIGHDYKDNDGWIFNVILPQMFFV